ncbi:MAG: nuclear transport factor 2 family protein [Actinomycetia bacterium]|nr:nuclear transport factor 2 family protein [Actinomycetes bacterium]
MERGDLHALTEMYSSDAQVVSHSRSAVGRDQIGAMHKRSLENHGRYEVFSIDQFSSAGDLIMWDATVQTEAGLLQTTHVVVLDRDGLIQYHVPGVRGYWGM